MLAVAVTLLIGACLFEIGMDVAEGFEDDPSYFFGAGLLWLPLAIGLWRLSNIARLVAMVLLTFILLMPLGGPYAMMDDTSPEPWSLWQWMAYFVPFVSLALLFIYVLDKHKAEFGCT